jgi:hypothetical protein
MAFLNGERVFRVTVPGMDSAYGSKETRSTYIEMVDLVPLECKVRDKISDFDTARTRAYP